MTPTPTPAGSGTRGAANGDAVACAAACAAGLLLAAALGGTLEGVARTRWATSLAAPEPDEYLLALRWLVTAAITAFVAMGALDAARTVVARRRTPREPFERECRAWWTLLLGRGAGGRRPATAASAALAGAARALFPWLLVATPMLAVFGHAAVVARSPAHAVGIVWDHMFLMVGLAGAISVVSLLAATDARRRLLEHPLLEQALLGLVTPRAITGAFRDAFAPARRLVLLVAPAWGLAMANNWFLRWVTSHADRWRDHPADLVLIGACLAVWSANFVAGCRLRAAIVATLAWGRRQVLVLLPILLGAALASLIARATLFLALRQRPPDWFFLPDWRGLTPSEYVLHLTIWCTLFEALLALGRSWVALRLWRRFEARFAAAALAEEGVGLAPLPAGAVPRQGAPVPRGGAGAGAR